MPVLTGTLQDVTGVEVAAPMIRRLFVRAPVERASVADPSALIVSAPVDLDRSGVLSVELEPGPAVLVVDTFAGGPDTYELHVTADMTLLSEALAESSPERSWAESVMVQLRADAVAAAERAETAADEFGLSVSAEALPPGSDPTVAVGGDGPAYEIEFGIPLGGEGNQGPVGDQGPDGDQGPLGDKGPQGDQGPVGDKGPDGDKGPTGDKGPDGDPGDKGPDGDKGPTGDPGSGISDASELTGALTDQVDASAALVTFAEPISGDPMTVTVWQAAQLAQTTLIQLNAISDAIGEALGAKADANHTHTVDGIEGPGVRSASTYLNGEGAFSTPPNTTYEAVTTAAIDAGTEDVARLTTASLMRHAVQRWVTGSGATPVTAIGQALAAAVSAASARATIGAEQEPWTGTQSAYNALGTKDPNRTYYIF